MKTKMWEEFWIELAASDPSRHVTVGELFQMKERIKRRHLPERVAEILKEANCYEIEACYAGRTKTGMVAGICTTIVEALRTGDLSEIEKWVK